MYRRDRIMLTLAACASAALFTGYFVAAIFGWLPERLRFGISSSLGGGKSAIQGEGLADPNEELGIAIGDFRYRFFENGFAAVTMPRELHLEKESLVIPERVEWQGRSYRVSGLLPYAFLHQRVVKSLTLPSGMTDQLLIFCDPKTTALEAIHVSPENPRLKSIDGILFNRSLTELLVYPPGNSRSVYTLPESVKTFAPHAFQTLRYPVTLLFSDGSSESKESSLIIGPNPL